MVGFIFGGDTGETPQSLARKRALVAQMMADQNYTANTTGGGVGNIFAALGRGIGARGLSQQADAAEKTGMAGANADSGSLASLIFGGGSAAFPAAPVGTVPVAPHSDASSASPQSPAAPVQGDVTVGDLSGAKGNMAEFTNSMYKAGLSAGLTDTQARLMAAQAAHESGNGVHAPGNNFFGIKAGKSWGGDTQDLWTHEEVNGQNQRMQQKFRKYGSPEQAIQDRIAFMQKNFPDAFNAEDINGAISGLQHGKFGSYATDSKYAQKLQPYLAAISAGGGGGAAPAAAVNAMAQGQPIPTQVASLDPSAGMAAPARPMPPEYAAQGMTQAQWDRMNASTPGGDLASTVDSPIPGVPPVNAPPPSPIAGALAAQQQPLPMPQGAPPPQANQIPAQSLPPGPVGSPAGDTPDSARALATLMQKQALGGGAPMGMQPPQGQPAPQGMPQQVPLPPQGQTLPPPQGAPQGQNPMQGQPGTPGQVKRGPDGKTYQYVETTGMAGATGPFGWIPVNEAALGAQPPQQAPQPQQPHPQQMAQSGPDMSQYGPAAGGTGGTVDPKQFANDQRVQMAMKVLQNPFANDSMRAVAQTIVKQAIDAQDPANALDKRYKEAQIASLEAKVGEKGESVYGTPIYGKDPKSGKWGVGVVGKNGTFQLLDTQGFDLAPPGTTVQDLGTTKQGFDRTGMPVGPSVAIDNAGKASDTALGKGEGDARVTYNSMVSKMPGLEVVVKQLDDLAGKATYTTGGQMYDLGRKELGLDPRDAAVARTNYIATVNNQILPLLRDTFGAQFTEREGETLRQTMGDPDKTPAEKQAVLKAFIEQKRRDVEALGRQTGQTPGDVSKGIKDMSDDELKAIINGN